MQNVTFLNELDRLSHAVHLANAPVALGMPGQSRHCLSPCFSPCRTPYIDNNRLNYLIFLTLSSTLFEFLEARSRKEESGNLVSTSYAVLLITGRTFEYEASFPDLEVVSHDSCLLPLYNLDFCQ